MFGDRTWLLAALAFAMGICPALADDKGPQKAKPVKPKIRVAKETTHLTEPLDKDGYVDYAAALNTAAAKGITPQNNAAALLAEVLSPSAFHHEQFRKDFYEKLGVPLPPRTGRFFLSMSEFADRTAGPTSREYFEALSKEFDAGTAAPWSPEKLPRLAAWLKYNEKPLETVRKATQRAEWYNPICGVSGGDDGGLLIGALLPLTQETREFARALAARALQSTQAGRLDDALSDLLACHRLGRLVGRGHFLIDFLVGAAVDAIAGAADLAVLQTDRLSEKQLAGYQKSLEQLPAARPVVETIGLTERILALDAVTFIARNGHRGLGVLTDLSSLFDLSAVDQTAMVGVDVRNWLNEAAWRAVYNATDWNEVLIRVNAMYDRLTAAAKHKRYADRKTALDEVGKQVATAGANAKDYRKSIRKMMQGDKTFQQAATDGMSNLLSAFLLPPFRPVHKADDRWKTRSKLTILAVALERSRKARGAYPARLDELQPRFVKNLPDELFTGKPFRYKRTEAGYLLYSVGPNLKDDGGESRIDGGDDVSVRMPPMPPQ